MTRSIALGLALMACGGRDRPAATAPEAVAAAATGEALAQGEVASGTEVLPAPEAPRVAPPAVVPLEPVETDRIKAVGAMDRRTLELAFPAFLSKYGFVLLEKTHSDSIDGDDPIPDGEHPSIKTTFKIGPCTPVEAYWIFATYNGAGWYPAPSARGMSWKEGDSSDREQVTVENPGKTELFWTDELVISRQKSTGEVDLLSYYERGEGWGITRFMRKVDETTWQLEDVTFAD